MDRAMSHSGPLVRGAREIAFMRYAHDLLHQSKARGDLGRGRQERDDALHISDLFGRPLSLEMNGAAFHHEAHLPKDTNILRRIAFEGDEIGQLTSADAAAIS
jgi:hypothetical protein